MKVSGTFGAGALLDFSGWVFRDTQADCPDTGVCRQPRNAILGAFLRVVLARIHVKTAQEVFWAYLGMLEGEKSQPAPLSSRN